MKEAFTWVGDLTRAAWLRPTTPAPWGSVASVLPVTFPAYARIFHPVERDRPRDSGSWLGVDPADFAARTVDIAAAREREPSSWAAAAASFGTEFHAEAQYARLVRRDDGANDGPLPADGWRYDNPSAGALAAASLSRLAAVLARHTTTPEAGIAGVWVGWGGLTSSAGLAILTLDSSTPAGGRLGRLRGGVATARGRLRRAVRQRLPGRFVPPAPLGSGLLSREAAEGPHLELVPGTGREYVLFEAGARALAQPGWPERAPWTRPGPWAQSPSLLWPDDHAWLVATEIDFDSTLVGGSRELIAALLVTAGLEVLPVTPRADLSWDGDGRNRPQP